MKNLFDKTKLGKMKLKNRIIRSATFDNLVSNELVDEAFQYYQELAQGGVGTIITGLTDVLSGGIYEDFFTYQYKQIIKMVHRYDAKIILQIGYVGSAGFKDNLVVWGPSDIENVRTKVKPIKITRENIRLMQTAFADAAEQAKKAGFDGVEIQGGQGFLLSQFLSPYYNCREDEYGGNIEKRAKFVLDVYQTVRKKVGALFPIIMKINVIDSLVPGMTFAEYRYVCEKLVEQGIDAVEVTGEWQDLSARSLGCFKNFAAKLAAEVDIPVILAGEDRDYDEMLKFLNTTSIEYFSLERPLLAEPDLVKRWENGDTRRAKCVYCNACLNFDGVFYCILNN
ncbi:MAG: dehydrogenase [Firmicutes bacterium]|nr:dehydrogenase [Bacillota bacterium]